MDSGWPLYAAFALIGGAARVRYLRYLEGRSAIGREAVAVAD